MDGVNLIQELCALQEMHGALRESDVLALGERLGVPLSEIEAVASFYPHFRRTPPAPLEVRACRDLSCALRGGREWGERLEALADSRDDVGFERVSCLGRCDTAPACTVNDVPVSAEDVPALLDAPERLPADEPEASTTRWQIDLYPEVEARYGVLRETLAAPDWDAALARLEASGLRGLGGAGFPTAAKWRVVREQPSDTRYVVCNADESEPGTFKDRAILEALPHLVLEGMALAAHCVGAARGIVYIRHEYARERRALEREIEAARRGGALGRDLYGSGFDFDVEVFVSPGGYIMGEETALLEALEGRRGEPRNKPPYPGVAGLWGQPTVINNVETLAQTPRVLRTGRFEFKVFSVSGDVVRPRVCEVPIGTTLAELVGQCGGLRDGRSLLAFLPGGASTAFLPASRADVALDWEPLRDAGSALGSGAVIVLAEGSDLLQAARDLTAFFRNESCGKCVPCRLGTEQAVKWIDAGGAGLARLHGLHQLLADTSICGLGQVALVPVCSVLDGFPELAGASEEGSR